ncbi:unnamed protein product [Sphagnum jensenii]|uniref:Uncharacterized protein n=1 Tax=Sphagnum jensenii TaxID=128206 RepID=A0ABP1BX59_9BRYO
MAEAEARRNNMLKEKVVVLEYRINHLGIVGRAYYEASQIKLRRNRYLIRAARTKNMLLHSALVILQQKERIARKEAGNLLGIRKQAWALHHDFDEQRKKAIGKQLQLQSQITNTRSSEIECANLLDPNTPPLLRIRYLDEKLKAIYIRIKHDEVLEKHLENILVHMRQERTLYSFQLETLTNIIDLKNNHIAQLGMVQFDSIKSRDHAKKELEEEGISLKTQRHMKKAIIEIKMVMEVDSMREMYQEHLLQEKKTMYLKEIHEELKTTLSQLRNEAPIPNTHKRKSVIRLQEVNGLVEKTKERVRHLSTRQHRENSYPLILLLEGTKKLVDKIHQGSQNVESDKETREKRVLDECEMKLVRLLEGISRKMNYLQKLELEEENQRTSPS